MTSKTVDVLVVGGGPAGLYAAHALARDGFDVTICEEHPAIGEPVHCTGVVAAETFDDFDVPSNSVLNQLRTVQFVSPAGQRISFSTSRVQAVVIDRAAFDRGLADRARASGATLRTATRVTDFTVDGDGVTAVAGGSAIRAKLAILACGAKYAFQRRCGLGLPTAYLHTAQREIAVRRTGDVEIHFGGEIAPSGFAWVVPVSRGDRLCARVGVMAAGAAPAWYQRMLERVAGAWGIDAPPEPPRLKILPLGPIRRTVADRVLAVGDAAGIVKPTTGGGIYYALLSASLAASTAAAALRRRVFDRAALAPYETAWRRRLAAEFESQQTLRRIAERMSDAEIDAFFELAKVDGIMPLVRQRGEFNRHRPFILALLKHPPARRILFRSLVA